VKVLKYHHNEQRSTETSWDFRALTIKDPKPSQKQGTDQPRSESQVGITLHSRLKKNRDLTFKGKERM
jgi:hypothetical protein